VGSVRCGVLEVLVGLPLGRVRPERWVEPPAVSTERFVGATAQDALGNHFAAVTVMVALLGALGAHLRVLVLESFVADLLAVVALFRSHLTFEDSRVS